MFLQFFWRNEALETQNPPKRRAGVPAKPGNIVSLSNSDTPRKSVPTQAFFGNGFALPEFSPFRAGCPQPERRNHAYIQRFAEPAAPVSRDGIGGRRGAPLPCPPREI